MKTYKRHFSWNPLVLLGGIFVLGFLLRLGVFLFVMGPVDSDEAIIGLMARHILAGERPLTYYGQMYYGPLDAYLSAVLFWLFGSSHAVLRIVPFCASLGFILVIYKVGERFYSRRVGLLSALLAAIGPFFMNQIGLYGAAGYSLILLIGSLSLLVFQDFVEKPTRWKLLGLVFLSMLGIWILPFMVYYLMAIGISGCLWLLSRRPFLPVKGLSRGMKGLYLLAILAGVVLLLIVVTPAREFLLRFSGSSFEMLAISAPILLGLWPADIDVLISLRSFFQAGPAIVYSTFFSAVVLLGGLIWGAKRFNQGKQLLFIFFMSTVMVYSLFYNMLNVTPITLLSPRYLFPLYSAIPLFADAFLSILNKRIWVFSGLLVWVIAFNLFSYLRVLPFIDRNPVLLEWLTRTPEKKYIYTDYWLAYGLAFESKEAIIPFVIGPENKPVSNRYPPYMRLVEEAANHYYIYWRGEKDEQDFRSFLQNKGITYKQDQVNGFVLYWGLSQPVTFDAAGPLLKKSILP